MTNILQAIQNLFEPTKPLAPGFYHYQAPPEDPLNYRLHLRIEADGRGVLIINAATVLHLNQTATEYAYHLVQETPRDEVARTIASRYRISSEQAQLDYDEFVGRIEAIFNVPDLDPVTYLDLERQEPYSGDISAPYRLDCALTYRLPEGATQEDAPTKRVDRELTTDEWKSVLDKAFEVGIPHVIFTGGEPTLRDDLVELITHAEANGQVTGLLTDGLRLGDTEYFDALLQSGLDHLLIILRPDDEKSWETLAGFSYWADVLEADIYVAVHLTITPNNAGQANQLLTRLAEAGVTEISLSASDSSLNEELQEAREDAADLDMALIWDLPVPYSSVNPVRLELEEEEDPLPASAGRAWLYVEPDGDVLPAQGINKVLGNFLTDAWEKIWGAAS